jgi:hypothetical protein
MLRDYGFGRNPEAAGGKRGPSSPSAYGRYPLSSKDGKTVRLDPVLVTRRLIERLPALTWIGY